MGSTVAPVVGSELDARLGDRDRGRAARAGAPSRRWFIAAVVGLGVAVAICAYVPFVIVALAAARHHAVFLGVDSWDPLDGLQYLAWVRDAHNGLIRSLFGSAHDGAVFVHPMWSPSGWVQAVTGVSDTAIMAFWTAVGALILFAGCLRLVTRQIPAGRPAARILALILALFGGLTPLVLLLPAIDPGAGGDLSLAGGDLIPAAALWGYVPMAIAVGLMPFAIEGVGRLLAGARDRRTVVGTAMVGLLIGWLHPWQGAALLAVSTGLVAWSLRDRAAARPADRRRPDRARRRQTAARPTRAQAVIALLVLAATAAPLLYYVVLSHVDPGWAVSELADRAATVPGALVALCLAPLVLLAVIAARRAGRDHRARGLVLWPFATLLVVALTPSGQDRALAGLAVPVAVLVVRGWPADMRRARSALATAAALAVVLVPGAVYAARTIDDLNTPYFTTDAELARADVRAAAVAARASGGEPILAPAALGTAIPALTDHASWVGHPIWTPDYGSRAQRSAALFGGSTTGSAARAFVRSTGARALIEPCGYAASLAPELAPLGFWEIRIGCARVYLTAGG